MGIDEKTRYLRSIFLQKILDFLVNILISFPKFIKIIHHGLFHSKQCFELNHVYPSLQTKSISSSCTTNFNPYLSPEILDINKHHSGPGDSIPKVMSFPQKSVVSNTQNRYIPLHLPQTLHEFPTKHYKYLPNFDGKSEDLSI